jgi:ABC-type glycerol-3-phosphate transport system substrate-binding protein
MYKKIFLGMCAVGVIAVGLVACGGGSGAGSNSGTATTINGIAVPPAPDAAANNATLAGVDSNGNGVRDDVERKAAALSSTKDQFATILNMAKAQQNILTTENLTKEQKINYLGDMNCFAIASGINEQDVLNLSIDNLERRKAYNKNISGVGALFSDELKSCKK